MDDNDDNENFEEYYDQHEAFKHELDSKTVPSSLLQDFYHKIKHKSCVLSKDDILVLCNKKGFFSNNIWSQYFRYKSDLKRASSILFGLKSGMFLIGDEFTFISRQTGFRYSFSVSLDEIISEYFFKFKGNMIWVKHGISSDNKTCLTEEKEILLELIKELKVEFALEKSTNEKIQRENFENMIKSKSILISELYSKLNIDPEGNLILEDSSDLNKILERNQKKIIEIDKIYIQKFVKIIKYLSEKKQNIISFFKSDSVMALDQNEFINYSLSTFDYQNSFRGKANWIIDRKNRLNEIIIFLKGLINQINTYRSVLFHSINMITSLIDNNLIVFYEIYECIDKLGIFNSTWENEVSNKLSNMDENLNDLVYSIDKMGNNIVNSVKKLTYVTQESFKDLNFSVNKQLSSIDSTMKFNNLLTLIQTYEVYKINQNTKRLN